jgi:hypothetical protein
MREPQGQRSSPVPWESPTQVQITLLVSDVVLNMTFNII